MEQLRELSNRYYDGLLSPKEYLLHFADAVAKVWNSSEDHNDTSIETLANDLAKRMVQP